MDMRNLFALLLTFAVVVLASAQNQLYIPDTLSGTNIELHLQHGTFQFFEGELTATKGANGNILGPTLILNKGDFVNFTVNNQLDDPTTIHWHGLHVAPENDGGPHTPIPANTSWTPSFTILDRAATYWYHPHLHHLTNRHVTLGIAGLIIIRDEDEAGLLLPRTYGLDDIPLIVQTKDFDTDNQIIVTTNNDDVVMVNATINPFVDLPAQVVRLRILNGASQRVFNFGLSNQQSFYQIASDAGLLSAPYETSTVKLAPGERAEILVDFSGMEGQTIFLKSFASALPNGIYGAINPGIGPGMVLTGYHPNPLNGNDFDVLQLNIVNQSDNPVSTIPTSLVQVTPYNESDFDEIRRFTFNPVTMGPNQLNGHFWINNAPFNMHVINITIPLDNIEIWEIENQTAIAHPFHIHNVPFYILDRNGVPPLPNELGRKDVVLVNPMESVRFITKFTDFANPDVPYMYHCHMLNHEDDGMMGQFIVVDDGTSTENFNQINSLQVFPNPFTSEFEVLLQGHAEEISIYDLLGRLLIRQTIDHHNHKVNAESLQPGLYVVKVITSSGEKFAAGVMKL